MADEESTALRRKLLKLDKNELARKCKRKHLGANGSKMDMVDRLIDYNEKNGGVSGGREGSKKNKEGGGKGKGEGGRSGGGGGGGGRTGGGGGGRKEWWSIRWKRRLKEK
eukprot:289031_1